MLSELPYSHIHYISRPGSRAAILNWFGANDVLRSHKEAFIDALLNFDDRCHHFFSYQTYFLAAEAIAFFPDCSQADVIVDQLLKWSYSFYRTSKSDWKIYPRALTIAAREALKRTDTKRVANRLAEIVHTTDSLVVLQRSAGLLGVIEVGNQAAILSLLRLIQQTGFYAFEFYPSERYFGWEAVEAMGKIAIDNSTTIAELTQMLSDAQEPLLRCHVAAALLRIDRNNFKAMTVLTEILETAQLTQNELKLLELETLTRHELRGLPEYLLWRAADSLARNNPNSHSAIDVLVQLVQTSISDTPCLPVLSSLLEIDSTKQLAINALIQLLETKPDDFLYDALSTFRDVEVGNELVITALTRLIQRSQSQSNRYAAAGALEVVDLGNSLAIATLIELLESDYWFGWSVAQGLANVDINNERSISALLKFVKTFQKTSDQRDRQRLTDCFKHLKSTELLTKVVRELKECLNPKHTDLEDNELENGAYLAWEDVEGVRSEVAYQIIWNCAQNMSYPDFYQAWTGEQLQILRMT